jgi:hypothetical protein
MIINKLEHRSLISDAAAVLAAWFVTASSGCVLQATVDASHAGRLSALACCPALTKTTHNAIHVLGQTAHQQTLETWVCRIAKAVFTLH